MKTFTQRVIEIALAIPKGKVTTYGRIAKAAGAGPMAAQSITSILAKADAEGEPARRGRSGKKIPFHRIVYADGRIWVDRKHRAERMKLYKKEGIVLDKKDRIENFADKLFDKL